MRPTERSGFTLVELMVVLAILVLLISVLVTVGHSQLEAAKQRETAAVLQTLQAAAQQFADEKPLAKVNGYIPRYGDYPPDELDGFVKDAGIPGSGEKIAPGALKEDAKSKNYVRLHGGDTDKIAEVDNGDIKAFALAVRLYSPAGEGILDRIQGRYRAGGHKDTTGKFDEFLTRNGNDEFKTGEDEPLAYFIDTWGTPIAYFATTDDRGECPGQDAGTCIPSNWDRPPNVRGACDRLRTCAGLLALSNDVPVFVSYGPDGLEQFSKDFLEEIDKYHPDLIFDYNELEVLPGKPKNTFDHPLNKDNVYSLEVVQSKIWASQLAPGTKAGGHP